MYDILQQQKHNNTTVYSKGVEHVGQLLLSFIKIVQLNGTFADKKPHQDQALEM